MNFVVANYIEKSKTPMRKSSKDEFRQSDIEKLYPSEFAQSNSAKKNHDDNMSLSTLFIKKDTKCRDMNSLEQTTSVL